MRFAQKMGLLSHKKMQAIVFSECLPQDSVAPVARKSVSTLRVGGDHLINGLTKGSGN